MRIAFLKSILGLMLTAGALGLFAGCASEAKPQAMIPKEFVVTHKHSYTTGLSVTGGKKTNPMWKSDISTEAFSEAIAQSIKQSGVFSSVINTGADYQLTVTLVKLMQPNVGFNMTVTAVTEWRLTEVSSGKVISEEYIATPFTATVGDAFAAIERIRLANEGSARENIKEGIRRLSELPMLGKSSK